MTMLVTGAAGFVGAAVSRGLVRAGHEVHAVVRPGTVADRLSGSGATIHRIDLHHTEQVAALVSRLAPPSSACSPWWGSPGSSCRVGPTGPTARRWTSRCSPGCRP